MEIFAGIITVLFGLFLVSLSLATVFNKNSVAVFFTSFASSAKTHYTEQVLRLTAGLGLLGYSKQMLLGELFYILGWGLVATSVLLLITPWKWHNKFGEWAIPLVIKNLILYVVSASILGLVILYSVVTPLLRI